ncbi:purine catabolism regulator [Murinocardiopsis flavida]|uniref:Purine catabolism regulator n=1 Tax=Murinocardiopsis flavida TaxID=645275 RepID=A0A2P8DGW1_9ACTN|nr:PucR family transcriptional regulator ligand-binding domain-containing protein [Murinocardiopsis flavida]PSK96452.1 purine catabolism regulator [Murinocardiopsis flavida]
MPLTIRGLLTHGELGLSLAAGAAGIDRAVNWVHASEVPDPTPWLDPGSLVIATGLGHGSPGVMAGTVRSLAATGAAGLGVAVDVVYAAVPEEVLAAGEETGLPILVVPFATPFVAIARAAADRIAEEERAALHQALTTHQRLTASVLEHGAALGSTLVLARSLGGWAAVADRAGRITAATPTGAAAAAERCLAELPEPAPGRTASTSDAEGHLIAYGLGAAAARGTLIAWRERPYTGPEYSVIAAAASLVTYESEVQWAARARARRADMDAVRDALRDGADPKSTARLAASWGLDPHTLVVAVVGGAEPLLGEPPEWLQALLADRDLPALACATERGEAVLVCSAPGTVIDPVRAAAERDGGPRPAGIGVSGPVGPGALADGLRQARQALAAGSKEGRAVTAIGDLGALDLLLASSRAEVPETLIRRLVDPLRRAGDERGLPLAESVRVFLDHNGSLAAAAAELGVHRHTLRSRLDLAGSVLGRDLDSSYVRLELGLAFQALALARGAPD